jgi:hypothetical protein
VYQEVSEVERRLSELQAQLDHLSRSLHLWREQQGQSHPLEQRLSRLAEQCAQIVERWSATGGRYAEAVGEIERRLGEWSATESRVARDASARIEDLQRVIEHEWAALRQMHEEPARQLREQASHLSQISMNAATSFLNGVERTEARVSSLEADLHRWLSALSEQMQTVAAEVRSFRTALPAVPVQPQSWPLEGVVRLHDQLRRGGDPVAPAPLALGPDTSLPPAEAPPAIVERMEALERELANRDDKLTEASRKRTRRGWVWASLIALLVAGLAAAAGVFVNRLEQQVGAAEARVSAAESAALAASREADEQITAAREDAARRIAEAHEAAQRAQTVGDVLAAPDLVRYNLVGGDGVAIFRAQALWSRSRGLVFSGTRLPVAPPRSTYQIWLFTAGGAVTAGLFVPDAAGRAMLATDSPPSVPGAITGISVTIEPEGGRPQPTGPTLLSRAGAG